MLDSRTVEEFNRFHVPGAVSCPGAELVHRFTDLVPDPETLVVVSCAGRTRSIIGAQSLINAGVPNRVVSLQGGTQAWRLQGLELERDTRAALAPVSKEAAERARRLADDVVKRFGIRRIDRATLDSWLGASARTTYLLDIRTPDDMPPGTCRDRYRPRAASSCRRSTAGSAPAAPASCWWTTPAPARS